MQDALGDVEPVTTDASNLDYAALATDGTALQQAAVTAGANPPPGPGKQAATWRSYFAWLAVAGGAYSRGQFVRAADAARHGVKYRPVVQAAADRCQALGA
jgi:hypothetical protein